MFKRDMAKIEENILNARPIINRRRSELKALENEGKRCKNNFRLTCIAQEVIRLTKELNEIENLVEELI